MLTIAGKTLKTILAVPLVFAALMSATAFAQAPPYFAPQDLDRLVQRVALYPDPLLAQIMAGATFSNQIPDAARWSDEHHYITGDALAGAITADQLPWDPSVQALLPFPNILDMMARDPAWTQQLGDAFLSNQQAVMDSVQRERRLSYNYGYLRSESAGRPKDDERAFYIGIGLYNPGYYVVPYYDPLVVFYPPRPGFFIGGAIGFNFGISLGVGFAPWGWGYNRFDWGSRAVFINNAPWGRTWVNRTTYVHPYVAAVRPVGAFRPAAVVRPGERPAERPAVAARPEAHQLQPRSAPERQAWQSGQAYRQKCTVRALAPQEHKR